jgi:hypothetical protein
MDDRETTEYRKARRELLADNPVCVWCKRRPATEADHLRPVDEGGTWRDGLVPSCKPCNASRGATQVNRKRANQTQARNAHLNAALNANSQNFLNFENLITPTPSLVLSDGNVQDRHDSVCVQPLTVGVGCDGPRLVTPRVPSESFVGAVARWTEAALGRSLFPWQLIALDGALAHVDGQFVHSTALISSGRQNGKTTMLSGLIGWALQELPAVWGRPVRIMSTAHELNLATEVWRELEDTFRLWEETAFAKVVWAYGRNEVRILDGPGKGSIYKVVAATGKKHGGTWDIILGDELWALSEETIFGALRPSQIAVQSPLMFLTSTAGDESSKAFLKLREQALGIIDADTPGDLFMAEWSLPSGVDPLDERYWGYANPALGRTISLKGLRSAAAAPDRGQFLRAHCNLWVAAASSWMPPGRWAAATTDALDGDGGWLAVDSAIDDSKYVGIWCRINSAGEVVATVKFATESNAGMWQAIEAALDADQKLSLAITPGLNIHTPERYKRRTIEWGYGEMVKYTGLIRQLILEGKVRHDGGNMLGEHVNRAVLVKAQGGVVISSQRSPGPIECARCLVIGSALVSRPGQTRKAAIAFG